MITASYGGTHFNISSDFDATLKIEGHTHILPHFSRTERKILRVLIENAGRVSTPRMFAAELYPGKPGSMLPDQKTLDVMVCHTRKKICKARLPDPITTVWGRGYRFGDAAPSVPSELIPPELQTTIRWVPQRKLEVMNLIKSVEDQRTVQNFFTDLSIAELGEWRGLYRKGGLRALTAIRAWISI